MLNFTLKCLPEWDYIVRIRDFIINILSGKITGYNDSYRIALIATELLENTCKYTKTGTISLELNQENDSRVSIVVKNITNKELLGNFEKLLKLAKQGNPSQAYKNMIIRSLDDEKISQLGIARIRYEGNSEISYTVDQNIESLLLKNNKIGTKEQELFLLNIKVVTNVKLLNSKETE